jgi:hypothetical protein
MSDTYAFSSIPKQPMSLVELAHLKQKQSETKSEPSSFTPKDSVSITKESALTRYYKFKESTPRFLPIMGFGAIGYYNKIKEITTRSVSVFDI